MARTAFVSVAGGGGTGTQDVTTGGSEFLTVIGVIGPTATALADVGVTVQPYLDDKDSPTLSDALVPAVETGTGILANNKAQIVMRWRVSGIRKVRIFLKNNNVGALPGEIDFDLG
jgi:hypothetical protein